MTVSDDALSKTEDASATEPPQSDVTPAANDEAVAGMPSLAPELAPMTTLSPAADDGFSAMFPTYDIPT